MLALREAALTALLGLGLFLGAALTPAMTSAQTSRPAAAPPPAAAAPARPGPAAPARPATAAPTSPAAPTTPGAAAPARPAAASAATTPAAAAPAAPSTAPSTALAPAAGPTPPVEAPPAPPVVTSPTGSIGGQLQLSRGSVPRHGVVYLESAPAGSWTLPKERPAVALRGFHFQPDFLVVPVGQTVQINNADRLMHSPFSLSPPKTFEISRHAAGETHTLSFDRPGVVDLFCNIHETMQAAIVVVPSTFYSLLAPDGSFQIGGVPPGRYRLIGYSPEADQVSQVVEVRSRERVVVKLQLAAPGQSPLGREKLR